MKSIRFSRKQLAIPYSVFLVLFVLIPIIIIIYYAFSDSTGAMSWSALVNFFTSRTKVDVLFRSLLIGLLNTIICLIIGYPLAYFLANKKFNKNYSNLEKCSLVKIPKSLPFAPPFWTL